MVPNTKYSVPCEFSSGRFHFDFYDLKCLYFEYLFSASIFISIQVQKTAIPDDILEVFKPCTFSLYQSSGWMFIMIINVENQ